MKKTDENKFSFKKIISIVLLLTLTLISILSLFDLAGRIGFYFKSIIKFFFGSLFFIFPLILIFLTYFLIFSIRIKTFKKVGLSLLFFSFFGILGKNSGYFGFLISYPFKYFFGFYGFLVIFISFFIISLILIFEEKLIFFFKSPYFNLKKILIQLRNKKIEIEKVKEEIAIFKKKEIKPVEKIEEKIEGKEEKIEIKKIDLPFSLLEISDKEAKSGNIAINKEIIKKTLENFNISVEMGEINIGPTVTQYTLKPADGIKLSQITSLQNDLSLALAAHPIRIEAPIPGKALMGIEVPNQKVAIVSLKNVLLSEEFRNRKSNLILTLGRDVSGKPFLADLVKMPHLLIAGATGTGKTVCIKSIILTLLYQNCPQDLKFILIDPKRIELPIFNFIPHLLTPVISNVSEAINALRWLIQEMDQRLKILGEALKKDISEYNKGREEKLPYIILVIDELADLMTVNPAEIEACIIRLAQMARATGIHLILATQRPSVDIITGLIKANITSRIAFSVASNVDSRTILDFSGAERLLGRGDMLFISPEVGKPRRLQGAYITEKEIENVVNYLKEKAPPEYLEEITKPIQTTSFLFSSIEDELYEEAKRIVIQAQKASASLLQRRLKIGYARAARLLDLLEEKKVIGPANGAKPRQVFVKDTEELTIDN